MVSLLVVKCNLLTNKCQLKNSASGCPEKCLEYFCRALFLIKKLPFSERFQVTFSEDPQIFQFIILIIGCVSSKQNPDRRLKKYYLQTWQNDFIEVVLFLY